MECVPIYQEISAEICVFRDIYDMYNTDIHKQKIQHRRCVYLIHPSSQQVS